MKSIVIKLLLIFACSFAATPFYGQDSLGPKPKKARTPEDYKSRTLKEIAGKPSDGREPVEAEDNTVVYGDISPSRVRVTYMGVARPLPPDKKDVLNRWAQRFAGAPEHYTVPYKTEMLFSEGAMEHWLAIRKQSTLEFEKAVKKGEQVDLFIIRLGGVAAADEWQPLLLIESFQKPK